MKSGLFTSESKKKNNDINGMELKIQNNVESII